MEHDQVHDQASFEDYVMQLRADLNDPHKIENWENTTLSTFLEGMEAWARDWSSRRKQTHGDTRQMF